MGGATDSEVPARVEAVLRDAIAAGATDLYWLPRRDRVDLRRRVGGRQEDLDSLPGDVGRQCLTHLKVLAGVLTYRTNVAQDGVIRRADGELRLATMPTVFGERITIRFADAADCPRHLDDLDFPADVLAVVRRLLARPHGLTILTGPTGCGKTTTIYALLRELLRDRQDPASIITIEDPVEQLIDGISQSAIRTGGEGWGYAAALRAALRQDVKTLVVGELRDADVARVALDAALTGHRVITTYHAGDIACVYARLLHQGFEPFLIAAAVTGVLAQRLARDAEGAAVPVVAVLEPDDTWREFIAGRPDLGAIRRRLADLPLADLNAAAQRRVAAGRLAPERAAVIL